MYGFVNQAVRDLVIEKLGEEAWSQVLKLSGTNQSYFVSDQIYDDEITYAMVDAIAREANMSVEQTLIVFGEFWVSFVDSRGFASLLSANGTTFQGFLANLDQFHSRLAMAYPEFAPPEFEFVDFANGQMELNYQSHRKGLGPMVLGILKGLANRYKTQVDIQMQASDYSAKFVIKVLGSEFGLPDSHSREQAVPANE